MLGTLFHKVVVVAALLSFTAGAFGEPSPPSFQKRQLKNGVTVLLGSIPGADSVAVETIYRVGFLHEPAGMIETAHLLEHLVCRSATKNYKAGESFSLLEGKGMVNAETLPTFTHYDYVVPAADLPLVLAVERERLSSLAITQEVIAQEAPKCRQEADTVEQNPKSGMLKHAFMAMSQAWRHGAWTVKLRSSELERIPAAALESFRAAHYAPCNLTLAIAGAVSDETWKVIEEQLGSLPAGQLPPGAPIDWKQLKNPLHVAWDAKVHAVCITAPAPASVENRLILTLWGAVFAGMLSSDPELASVSNMATCSNPTWPIGELPFFVYAVPKTAADVDRVTEILRKRIRQVCTTPLWAKAMYQLNMHLSQYVHPTLPTWESLDQQAQALAPTVRGDVTQARRLILGNVALQAGMLEIAPRVEGEIQPFTPERVAMVLRESLDDSRLHVTILTPSADAEKK